MKNLKYFFFLFSFLFIVISCGKDDEVIPDPVNETELEKRGQEWQPPAPNITSGYVARYAKLVTSGSTGAILKD